MAEGETYPRWRLLAPLRAGGSHQMALDQSLLERASAPGFLPTLRFQVWEPPALSLGRFQDIAEIDLEACAREGIEVVRRPTGGKSILHLDDFTYSVVFPGDHPLPESVVETYAVICRGILFALRGLGLQASIRRRAREDYSRSGGACFAALTEADLECGGRKICGSAQVRRGGAVLQHGSILLRDRSRLLFELLRFAGPRQREEALSAYRERCVSLAETGRSADWKEMAAAFERGFEEGFGIELVEGELTEAERERWLELVPQYRSRAWLMNADRREPPGW